MPAVFLPYSFLLPPETFVIARTKGDPEKSIGVARDCVRAVDRNQPITLTRTLEGWLNTATAYQSFSTFLFGVFGAVGMLLAASGVFSVVSYSVEHRTREFGIRMALGANPREVFKLILIATGRVLAVGLLVGVGLSILASRMLADQMAGMGKGDPVLFVFVPMLLILTTLAASFLPARTATRIQPMEALRHDWQLSAFPRSGRQNACWRATPNHAARDKKCRAAEGQSVHDIVQVTADLDGGVHNFHRHVNEQDQGEKCCAQNRARPTPPFV